MSDCTFTPRLQRFYPIPADPMGDENGEDVKWCALENLTYEEAAVQVQRALLAAKGKRAIHLAIQDYWHAEGLVEFMCRKWGKAPELPELDPWLEAMGWRQIDPSSAAPALKINPST